MGFSRQLSGLSWPPSEDLPDPGIEPRSPTLQADSLPSEPPVVTNDGWGFPLHLGSRCMVHQNSMLSSNYTRTKFWPWPPPHKLWCSSLSLADPTWLSTNLGILTCIECSGIHRELGVHYSRMQSLTLDVLGTSELLVSFRSLDFGILEWTQMSWMWGFHFGLLKFPWAW